MDPRVTLSFSEDRRASSTVHSHLSLNKFSMWDSVMKKVSFIQRFSCYKCIVPVEFRLQNRMQQPGRGVDDGTQSAAEVRREAYSAWSLSLQVGLVTEASGSLQRAFVSLSSSGILLMEYLSSVQRDFRGPVQFPQRVTSRPHVSQGVGQVFSGHPCWVPLATFLKCGVSLPSAEAAVGASEIWGWCLLPKLYLLLKWLLVYCPICPKCDIPGCLICKAQHSCSLRPACFIGLVF